MTPDQTKQLLACIGALCRTLGAENHPDETPQKQSLHGLAFVLGSLLKEPDRIRGLATLACRDYSRGEA